MPPELAALTHEVLTSFGRRGERPTTRVLYRELSSFSADARGVRALFSAGTYGLAPAAALEAEVRDFLRRSWERLAGAAAAAAAAQRGQLLKRAAALLGHLLLRVPEPEARDGFGRVLAEWAAPARAGASGERPAGKGRRARMANPHAVLEELTVALVYADELSPEARESQARRLLRLLQQKPRSPARAVGPSPKAVAEAVATLTEAMPALLAESVGVFRSCLAGLSVADIAAGEIWTGLADAPPRLRLIFLCELSAKGGASAWEACGVDALAVADTCADFAAVSSGEPRHDRETEAQVACLLKQLGDKRLAHSALAPEPDRALALARSFGPHLRPTAPRILRALVRDIQQRPGRYAETDVLAAARALAGTVGGGRHWVALASALVARWSAQEPRLLFEAMSGMPATLKAAPRPLLAALAAACERRGQALLALEPGSLEELIDAWASPHVAVPAALRQLLGCAVERHASALDARRLVAASRILGENSQPTAAAEVMLYWQTWVECMAATRELTKWSRYREALREVRQWRDSATASGRPGAASLAEMVLQGVVAHHLCNVAEGAPLELLLELGRLLTPSGAAAVQLVPKLEDQLRRCLRGGEGGGVPLVAAVSVANGETLVPCGPEAPLWGALTLSIAAQLQSVREVDLFCRCQPKPALRAAILELMGGDWRALELQIRFPS